jgi:5-methylcytosine-specific restriction endonuclease McrA
MGLPRKWNSMSPKPPVPRTHGRGSAWNRFRNQLMKARGIYACERCKAIEDKLEAHHVISVRDNPSLEYEPRNIMFVCLECHHNIHNSRF